ncbi:membrane protein [Microbacterium phage Eleri]|uniref:Membrane protein n=4 Tax=Elerivirus eleri TaxID=2560589 RepID=A0A6N0A543_9CAUD|nr:membrane protein [Microbacterium phage Eleri]AXH70577.1 membrane protein [Microbacterium phage ColaCorta]AXH70702.1 membrane protein [Microbacterium phage Andromedas]QKO02652.1 membrane protein [Microbacterium phage Glamour]UDG78982.1 membrane protein [Microbacterium phage Saratos]WNN95818.1 membrane protein [Microbacterium phage ChikPic]
MLEVIERIGAVLTPILVTVITVYGGVLVARLNKVNNKVEKVQSDIITNHGSKNIGDAIDRLTTKVGAISENQDRLILDVAALKRHDAEVDTRLDNIDKSSTDTRNAVTDTIRVVKPFHKLVDKLKGN